MLQAGALKMTLLAHRNKVHVRNPTPRHAESGADSSSGPSFGDHNEEAEDPAVEIEAINEAILESNHHEEANKHQAEFFANQFWRAPDICE